MTGTLTDHYIAATVRTLSPTMQTEVRAELEATIADEIEARVERGATAVDAERSALTALGDPDVLASSYAERPLHLIGPKYYLTWWRALKLLLWVVPVIAAAGALVAQLMVDAPVADVVSSMFTVAISSIIHVAFWTTLVFVVLERISTRGVATWTPDSLPAPLQAGATRAETVASLAALGITAGVLLWDRFIGFVFVADDGVDVLEGLGSQTTSMPVLNPDLWPWWLGGVLSLMACRAVLSLAISAQHGWTSASAWVNTALSIALAAMILFLLLTSQLLNPDLLAFTLGRGGLPAWFEGVLAVLLGVGVVGAALWATLDGWRKARLRI